MLGFDLPSGGTFYDICNRKPPLFEFSFQPAVFSRARAIASGSFLFQKFGVGRCYVITPGELTEPVFKILESLQDTLEPTIGACSRIISGTLPVLGPVKVDLRALGPFLLPTAIGNYPER
jgi:hypothetical protein